MIMTSDREYKLTRRIKQGKKHLQPPFAELAQWIADRWNVTVLNVICDRANSLHAPRLQVILEYETHVGRFRRGMNFDEEKQQAIADKFLEILDRDKTNSFDVDGLFVVFSAFTPLAIEEADTQLSEKDIKLLKRQINNQDLWEVSRCFGHVTFFFYTDDEMKRYEAAGKKEEYARLYYNLLKQHDEFGYLRERDFKVNFDSKQNFDKKYGGNWFNYYR